MELWDAIRGRHSVRLFDGRPVPAETIERLVAAAAAAPSAQNSQPAHFHVTTGATRHDVGKIMALSTRHLDEYVDILPEDHIESARQFFATLGDAPAVVLVSLPVSSDTLDSLNNYIAAGCAIENLVLAATEEGLGACNITFSFWVRDELAKVIGLSEDREVGCILVLGWPAESPVSPAHDPDIATFHE